MKHASRILSLQCARLSGKTRTSFPALFGLALVCLLAANALFPASSAFAARTAMSRQQEVQRFIPNLLAGAREEVARRPLYKSAYYSGGFPPANEGVCTDLVWRALAFTGYDLKKYLDADIRKNTAAYPRAHKPDPNIDFRRVPNQTVFFRRHAQTLTTRIDAADLPAWQAGDLVVFANPDHIAILSDKRNSKGLPLLLHNQGPVATEADDFMAWYTRGVVAHFRFIP